MNLNKKLWLVDDDDIFVFLTKRIIESTNFDGDIKVFRNGQNAIDFLEQVVADKDQLPELIFLDLSMPVLDGWGFLEEFIKLKSKFANKIPVYLTSSSVSPHDVQRAKDIIDVCDFIIKPVTKERFVNIIQHLTAA